MSGVGLEGVGLLNGATDTDDLSHLGGGSGCGNGLLDHSLDGEGEEVSLMLPTPGRMHAFDSVDGIPSHGRGGGGGGGAAGCPRMRVIYTLGFSVLFVVVLVAALEGHRSTGGPGAVSGLYNSPRLPRSVLPSRYSVVLRPDAAFSAFDGTVEINATVRAETDLIVLHAAHLAVSDMSVWVAASPPAGSPQRLDLVAWGLDTDEGREYLVAQLTEPLAPGMDITIRAAFRGDLSGDSLVGLYVSRYEAAGVEHQILTTQFESTFARQAFPCFDEPAFKAVFALSIAKPAGFTALSNMPPLNEAAAHADHSGLVAFADSPVMSTYLVAVVVCDFDMVSTHTDKGVLIRVWAPKVQVEQGELALRVANATIPYYEGFYGINYPLPKMDLVAIPDFGAGAMENWGLITYRETALLYDPVRSAASEKQRVAVVVAHELGHQWFGNLVTMRWWNQLWLNEGFATFLEYQGVVNSFGPGSGDDWLMAQQFMTDAVQYSQAIDALESTHALSSPEASVVDLSDIEAQFDAISYEKGGSVIRMLQGFAGSAFQAGLRRYLKRFAHGNAGSIDLWNAIQAEVAAAPDADLPAGLTIPSIMRAWTETAGFPRLDVSTPPAPRAVSITQARFHLHGAPQSSGGGGGDPTPGWVVPVTIRDGCSTAAPRLVWLTEEQASFPLAACAAGTPGWYKLNVDTRGFYRVNYPRDNWLRLTALLDSPPSPDVLSPNDKAGLLSDGFAFLQAGSLDVELALGLTRFLEHSGEYVAWLSGLAGLRTIGAALDGASQQPYRTYVNRLLQPQVTAWLQNGATAPTGHVHKLLRSTVLKAACGLGNTACLDWADALFRAADFSDPDTQGLVYDVGVQRGGEPAWSAMWARYKATDLAGEQRRIFHAIAQTQDVQLIQRTLERSLDRQFVRKQDMATLISTVAKTEAGRPEAWNFLKAEWETLSGEIGTMSFAFGRMISSVVDGFNTRAQLADMHAFFDGRETFAAERAVSAAFETVEANVAFTAQYQARITTWLQAQGP